MKECFSPTELSKIFEISVRAVTKRAHIEDWKNKITCGRGKNGKRHFYYLQSMSPEDQKKIIAHKLGVRSDFVSLTNPDFLLAEAGLKKWSKATDFNRKIAQSREIILNKLYDFVKINNLSQGIGEERFASFYNANLIKEIPPVVFDKISTLSAPTLRRWRAEKEKSGLPGLLGDYGKRKGQQKAITSEQSDFIISHINTKPHIRPEHIFKILCKTFEKHPSRRTVYRFIDNWKKENPAFFALIEDPRRWKNSYMAAFGDASADVPHFGHTWEMDNTPANVFVTSDNIRFIIVGQIDVYASYPEVIAVPVSNGIAIAACIRKAILTQGIPLRIKMDNGRDYQSKHTKAVTSALKIETPELPKYSPEKKPFIERFFGTFATSFEELVPKFIGPNVEVRKAIQAKETWGSKIMKPGITVEVPLTYKAFQGHIEQFLNVYRNTPQKRLGGKTPLEKSKESPFQPKKIRDERLLDVLLAPTGRRIVGKKGISLDGSYFVSDELIEYIGKSVEIRRDLSDAGIIYIFDGSGKYLCNAKNEPLRDQSLENYLIAKKKNLKNLKDRKRALDKVGLSSRTALQILLEDDIEHSKSNIIPFQGDFENETVKEVKKAVADIASEKTFEAVPKQINKAVNGYDLDSLLDNSHMTNEEYDREFEELKRNRDKRMIRVHR